MDTTLGQVLSALLPFEVPQIATVAGEILKELEYLQYHGIVHSNLNPMNILLNYDGEVKIADFSHSEQMRINDDLKSLGNIFIEIVKPGAHLLALIRDTDVMQRNTSLYTSEMSEFLSAIGGLMTALAVRKVNPTLPYVATNKSVNIKVDEVSLEFAWVTDITA
ncbi:uncharacterized protein H6S33_004125 [Morchella sextelata]|uniref:uncharacterized protein n=1 Tax=Morchella sextelata TaxID=1174677 RepID=UPI001D0556E7|nr:uncharacterized protein H6S33_004125 [Morchella sextelata]KAH0606464.1 hypothetical protein H6S33_004125 [Morchella sextelata]